MEVITDQRLKQTWRWLRLFMRLALIFSIFMVLFLFSIFLYAKIQGPPTLLVPQTTVFYASDGSVVGESEHGGQNRYWVPLKDISPNVIDATIAIEDKRFYDHYGFDFKRIIAAGLADIKAMSKVQGASTITQQYARNLFLEHDKTWTRKIQEALYAIRLELNYTKEEILEGYLNTIYYGHGAYGIEAAADYYFDKHAKDLTLGEAAMLAGIPKGPSYYSPKVHFERAKDRQETILDVMAATNKASGERTFKAKHERIILAKPEEDKIESLGPYFLDEVKKSLVNRLNLDQRFIEAGGLKVYTTLDPHMQKTAEKWVGRIIHEDSDIQTALTAMDPKTGEVKALVGGRDYEKSEFNRATMAKRAPGSTFKAFLYYAAIENGFTPSTPVRSEPTTFRYNDGKSEYSPHNYGNAYAYGDITLAQALALSDNIVAVKTHLFLEENTLVNTAKRFGIKSPLAKIPSLALGTKPVRMIEMTGAYSMFANGGKSVEPHYITKVVDREGNVIYEWKKEAEQVLDPDAAFVTTQMMTGVFDESLNDYARVTGSGVDHLLSRQVAGKTGSTPNDSWMIGFTPQLTASVWVGYDEGKPLNETNDGLYAKNIWAHFIEEALEGQPKKKFKPTKNVIAVNVNPDNGKLATENCPVTRKTYYIKGTEPHEYCDEHSNKQPKAAEKEKKEKKGFIDRIFDWFK
ncbi:transglycosylase domain-containing protein [Pseudalkalibacillus caeni]|uniref:Penicillin-binding protein 1A n=1 Tax=Exobacillus caeni TaxID=2574798 RepID=A0A5R9EZL6_9BACL|nr:penicillin-binding protein 1A [Pseudalkalibacillus caeni]TLS36677.1 penicillin-binding protein 1A [Pseudalkalibacillus caeni]